MKCSISLGFQWGREGEEFLEKSIVSERLKKIPERKTFISLCSSEALCRSSCHSSLKVLLMHVQSWSAFTYSGSNYLIQAGVHINLHNLVMIILGDVLPVIFLKEKTANSIRIFNIY